MARVSAAVAVAIAALSFLASASASAAPARIAIDTLTPELERAEAGDGSKVDLSFINLTDGAAKLEAETAGCKPTLSASQLPPNQITPVTVEFPSACAKEGLSLKLTALTKGASQQFEVKPTGAAAPTPNWHQLWAFAISLGASLLLGALFFGWWWTPRGKGKRRPWQPLGSLDATWKFNDNWATNATAVGALLSGLFSVTTAKSFLGEDAEALTALATVGGAIALALVGAAPIVTLATKSYKGPNGKRGDAFTVGGVLLGAAFIIAAAAGQLWVVAYTASELKLGTAGWLVWVGFGIAMVILVVYSFRSLRDLLERGTEEKHAEPSAEIVAAKMIAKAIEAANESAADDRHRGFAELGRAFKAEEKVAGGTYRHRSRSALL